MLTINRDKTADKRNRTYDSRVRDRYSSDSYRTLEEDYQNTVRQNESRRQDDLWSRLSSTSAYEPTERQDMEQMYTPRSSAYSREQETYKLPYYSTEAPTSSMAMKKYPVHTAKKKTNVTGKIILAVYVAVIALVASLVIVDSTMKTTAASSSAPTESEYQYIAVEDTQDSSNWFDQFCDSISSAMGD